MPVVTSVCDDRLRSSILCEKFDEAVAMPREREPRLGRGVWGVCSAEGAGEFEGGGPVG